MILKTTLPQTYTPAFKLTPQACLLQQCSWWPHQEKRPRALPQYFTSNSHHRNVSPDCSGSLETVSFNIHHFRLYFRFWKGSCEEPGWWLPSPYSPNKPQSRQKGFLMPSSLPFFNALILLPKSAFTWRFPRVKKPPGNTASHLSCKWGRGLKLTCF